MKYKFVILKWSTTTLRVKFSLTKRFNIRTELKIGSQCKIQAVPNDKKEYMYNLLPKNCKNDRRELSKNLDPNAFTGNGSMNNK